MRSFIIATVKTINKIITTEWWHKPIILVLRGGKAGGPLAAGQTGETVAPKYGVRRSVRARHSEELGPSSAYRTASLK